MGEWGKGRKSHLGKKHGDVVLAGYNSNLVLCVCGSHFKVLIFFKLI